MGGSNKSQKYFTVETPYYLPGQEAYLPEFIAPLKETYAGNLNTALAQKIGAVSTEAGKKAAGEGMLKVSSTRGISTPAKQRTINDILTQGISSATAVPMEIWSKVLETLAGYSFAKPGTTSAGRGGGGGGWKIGCWVWTHFDGEDGSSTMRVRVFRDVYFGKGSDVDLGYRMVGQILKPLLRLQTVEFAVFALIFVPITNIASGKANWVEMMMGRMWKVMFEMVGKVGRKYGYQLYHSSLS